MNIDNTPISSRQSEGPREAIVLAGGRGTRLASLVSDVPKPLAQIGGRPFLERTVEMLREAGIRRLVFATGHLGTCIEAHFGDGSGWGVEMAYALENTPLGTGGAVRHALKATTGNPLLVLNGDSLCRIDLPRLSQLHAERGAMATLWLLPQADCRRFASVAVAPDGTVLGFREKAATAGAGLISAGVYLLDRRVIAAIPADRAVSIEHEVFPALVGHGLAAAVGTGDFVDIGTPESYAGAAYSLDRIMGHD